MPPSHELSKPQLEVHNRMPRGFCKEKTANTRLCNLDGEWTTVPLLLREGNEAAVHHHAESSHEPAPEDGNLGK